MNFRTIPLALCVATSAAHAQLYIQSSDRPSEPSFFSDAVAGQFFSQRMADNFTLDQAGTATAIQWWGGSQNFQFADTVNMQSYTIELYTSDLFGAPDLGNVLLSETVSSENMRFSAVATGETLNGGGIEYGYTLELLESIELAADTQYWISVGATLVDGGADAWVWSGSTQGDLVNATDFFTGGYTVFDPTFNDLAFAVVPAPSTAVAGLLALGFTSRRRR